MLNQQEIQYEPFYLLRTPLLPLNTILELNELPPDAMEMALKDIFRDPLLQEALYVASPELFGEFDKLMKGLQTNARRNRKLIKTLYKYLVRMSSRSTPYGLFAGCSVGQYGETTQMRLAPHTSAYKYKRLDMNYVAELAAGIAATESIRNQLRYFPNNSAYIVSDKLRYIEFSTRNKKRFYNLASVDYSDYLELILQKAGGGATMAELTALLVSDEITEEEASAFIGELVSAQILISELEPTITGDDFLRILARKLEGLEHTGHLTPVFQTIIQNLEQQNPEIENYHQIETAVNSVMRNSGLKDLVQVDLFHKAEQNQLSHAIIKSITEQTERLFLLGHPHEERDLEDFKRNFFDKYEEREMPLAEVLDPDYGIGYATAIAGSANFTPLIEGFTTEQPGTSKLFVWDSWMQFMLKKYTECVRENKTAVELTDADIDRLSRGKEKDLVLPGQFYLMGHLTAATPGSVTEDNYQFIYHNLMGPASCETLGRFCSGSAELNQQVQQVFEREQERDPDIIYAEVIHLPQNRAGNILIRPLLRQYEIPYITPGAAASENQLPVSDLMVSIRGGQVVLRSKRLNKRVMPRLTTAHNFSSDNLAMYKFLCDLQSQGFTNGFYWNWDIFENEPFIPRVTYRNIVLRKARWTLYRSDFSSLAKKEGHDMDAFRAELQARKLPRHLTLTEGDNAMLIDTHNVMALRLLADNLIKRRSAALTEFVQPADTSIVAGDAGVYVNEIIFPFKTTTNAPLYHPYRLPETPMQETVARAFTPGSDWLYVKIYCGTKTSETMLTACIAPLITRLRKQSLIKEWFFIRFADPGHHIRIRFYNPGQPQVWQEVMALVNEYCAPLVESRVVDKIQYDTYKREIERYGAATIGPVESLFHADSMAVLSLIGLLQGDEGETYRWLICLRGIDVLLDDFGYTLEQKLLLLQTLQADFHKEYGNMPLMIRQLNAKYRAVARKIDEFLNPETDGDNNLAAVAAILAKRSASLQPVIAALSEAQAPDNLLPSFIHMFCNRIFIARQRKHELVVYHYLARYYESLAARTGKETNE
jgi:lantibiotic biosynthesis protein